MRRRPPPQEGKKKKAAKAACRQEETRSCVTVQKRVHDRSLRTALGVCDVAVREPTNSNARDEPHRPAKTPTHPTSLPSSRREHRSSVCAVRSRVSRSTRALVRRRLVRSLCPRAVLALRSPFFAYRRLSPLANSVVVLSFLLHLPRRRKLTDNVATTHLALPDVLL